MSRLPGSDDAIPINNVTSRKKPRPRPVEDDGEDEISGSSSSKKRRYNRTKAREAGASDHVRRNLNLSFLSSEANRKERARAREGAEAGDAESLEAVVNKILESHLKLRKIINAANCFEHKTVLDVINNDVVRHESMADMAMILNSAVEVYGLRVDRCYIKVQDTRGHITSSFNPKDGHHNEDHNDAIRSPRRRRRDDIKQNIGDWKARLNEDGEQELNIPDEEDEEGSSRRHIPEEDSENFLDNIPNNAQDLNTFLNDLMEQRRSLNNKIHSVNTHIIEDGDDLMDKTNKELSSNEYYQKAVSRYGEGNSAAMLMNNAKFSSESQAYLIHSRITTRESTMPETVGSDFIKQIKATLANSLSAAPKKVERDLLPALAEVYHNSDEDSDEDDNFTVIDEQTEAVSIGIDNPPKSPRSKASELRRSIVFRGKNMSIERTWVTDDLDLNLALDTLDIADKEDFSRFENYRKEGTYQEDKSKLPLELDLSTTELKERSKYFEVSGLDEDVRELDNLWNSQVVKSTVTTEEMIENIRVVEQSGGTAEEIQAKKMRILQPGDYVFFIGSNPEENPIIPVDDWSDEGAESVLDIAGNDVFYDAEDDFEDAGGNEDLDLPYEAEADNIERTFERAEKAVDDIRSAMDRDTPAGENESHEAVELEDIADVPVNPGVIPEKPDEAIRNLGKEDNAHWKGRKNAEPAGEIKKQRKTRTAEDKNAHLEEYWTASDAEMRRKALCKYSARPNYGIEKEDTQIFFSRPANKRAFHLYKFEDFNKVSCLNGSIEYYGREWDTTLRTEELMNRFMSMQEVTAYNEEGDESIGVEFMRAVRGLKLKWTKDEPATAPLDAARGTPARLGFNDEGYNPYLENMMHDHCYEDIGRDVDSPGADSFHTAPGGHNSPDQDFNEAIEMLPWVTRKNKLQEIRELQAAEDIEEEGEIAEGLEGTASIIIRNTTIDQSKVKSYLKNILTNRMMDRKCLETVAEAANDNDYLDQTVAAVRELTLMNPGQDISMMNRSFEFKDTGIDPLEVSRVVFNAPDQPTQAGQGLNTSTNQDGPSQEALTNAVVLSDFQIEGEHTLSSIMACLPFRAQRNNEKNMHVALLFSIALQMCNENTLHCVQNPTADDGNRIGDFVLRNGASSQANGLVEAPRPRGRPNRLMQEVIPEEDEANLDDSAAN